ncbi:MAG: 6-phosphogluconolactonase [Fimbriimonadia bacterium]|jgi:6-phosphogluconolactonase
MRGTRIPILRIVREEEDFAGIIAGQISRRVGDTVAEKGVAVLALGAEDVTAPVRMRLGEKHASDVPWQQVIIYQVCERMWVGDHREALYERLWAELLSRVGVPPDNVHRFRGDASDAGSEVRRYEEQLLGRVRGEVAGDLFDLVVLGVEADGGTAGLRPDAEAVLTSNRHVAACPLSPTGSRGFSLTPRALNRSESIWIVVSGSQVAGVVHDTLEGDIEPTKHPLQALRPRGGEMVWYLDTAAAQRLGILAKDARPL